MKILPLILRLSPVLAMVGCNRPAPPVEPSAPANVTPAVRLAVVDAGRPEWGPLTTLDDGQTVLQLAPTIGRVMHLSRAGETNLLWTSNDPARERFGGWTGFGGEKLWPWPQKPGWDWPPPIAIDTGPYRSEPLSDGRNGVRCAGPVDPASGLAGTRDTWIGNGEVHSRYTLDRRTAGRSAGDGRIAAWSVAQVPVVEAAYVRLLPGQSEPATTTMSVPALQIERLNDRWLKVIPQYVGAKVGIAGDLIAVPIRDRLLVIERLEGNTDPGLERATCAQLYFHRIPKKDDITHPSVYAEIEFLGPSKPLAAGDSCTLATRWTILPVDQLPDLLNRR